MVMPAYRLGGCDYLSAISTAPSFFRNTGGPTPGGKSELNVRRGRNMILEIQVPPSNDMMPMCNRKQNFECFLVYNKNPVAYARIKKIVNERGIHGVKAYFAAELRSRDELAINVAECLPESRF